MVQGMTQFRLTAIPLVSLIGGTPSFPTPPLSSPTVPFGEPTLNILPTAVLTISQTILIS
jgi:hypothetical protein